MRKIRPQTYGLLNNKILENHIESIKTANEDVENTFLDSQPLKDFNIFNYIVQLLKTKSKELQKLQGKLV